MFGIFDFIDYIVLKIPYGGSKVIICDEINFKLEKQMSLTRLENCICGKQEYNVFDNYVYFFGFLMDEYYLMIKNRSSRTKISLRISKPPHTF